MAAVNAADPSGRAMAVVRADEQYAQGRVELIGIQSELLSTVAIWRGQDAAQLSALADQLRGRRGKTAAVGADLRSRVDSPGWARRRLRFGAMISAPGQPPTVVWLGDVREGLRDYTGAVPACAAHPCRLVGLAARPGRRPAGPSTPPWPCRGALRRAVLRAALRRVAAWKIRLDPPPT